MQYIRRTQMLLSHLSELRKVGNTTLLINGLANYKEKFYLLSTSKREFEVIIKKAMLIDPTVKDRAMFLSINRLNGVIVRRFPIAIDLETIDYLLRNILNDHFEAIDRSARTKN